VFHIHISYPFWLALWIAAGTVLFLLCLPMILGLLGATRIVLKIDDGTPAEESDDDPQSSVLLGQLRSLGFTPFGSYTTSMWFFMHYWVKRIHHRMFASERHRCCAAVFELFPGDGLRVTLTTRFEDDFLVSTANALQRLTINRDSFSRIGFPTSDMTELLTVHEQRVARRRYESSSEIATPSLTELVRRARELESRPGSKRRAIKWAWRRLVSTLLVILAPWALVAYVLEIQHALTPEALLLIALVQPFVQRQVSRAGARETRRLDAAARLDAPPRVEEWRADGGRGPEGDGSITSSSVPPR